MRLIKTLYKKYSELILYAIAGGLTTLVNFVTFFFVKDICNVYYITANIIAWFVSVVFAFVINKVMVFKSSDFAVAALVFQLLSFAGFRALSGAAETLILYLFVDYLLINEYIVKIIASVMIIIANYIFSKLFVFKKNK